MKIIVVDDTTENLNAAKEAAKEFSEHEFVFTNSAAEAIKMLPNAEGVVTDLFFPNEGHEDFNMDKLDLSMTYNDFYIRLGEELYDNTGNYTNTFRTVVSEYYNGNYDQANWGLMNALDLVNEGTIRGALDRLIKRSQYSGRDMSEYRERLNGLPSPQFPYGAAIMLAAKEAGKRHVLVSDIHAHATKFDSAASAIDAMALLLPLIAEEIMTVDEVKYDGRDSRMYLGSSRIRDLKGKVSPTAWAEAIRMVSETG